MEMFSHDDMDAQSRRKPARTILIVDGDSAERNRMGKQLTAFGYHVVLCENGAEALDLIAARGFDLVMLSIATPASPGFDILGEIRANRETTDLPVILITTEDDPHAAVQALASGADDHLSQPFAFEVLAARIDRVLHRARRVAELKRSNAVLDARIATRAMELGEAKVQLAETRADRLRLIASLQSLNDRFERGVPGVAC